MSSPTKQAVDLVEDSSDFYPNGIMYLQSAFFAGLGCMIRKDHPRRNARLPNTRGVVYLAFSKSTAEQWSLAIDTFSASRGDFGSAVFNEKYHAQFVAAELPFAFEGRNRTAGHLVVSREQVFPTLKAMASFDDSVLRPVRSTEAREGFTKEYVIQREILLNWEKTPWAGQYDVVQDEFPVDGGLTSRSIEILAHNGKTGDWLVIELKRAESSISAVHQVAEYLLALGRRDDFANGRLHGVLVAEHIPESVRVLAKTEGISTYEITWPLNLSKVE